MNTNEGKSNTCLHCGVGRCQENQTFCSQICYRLWQLVTEGGTKPETTKPEICKTNSLLATVNNEFN